MKIVFFGNPKFASDSLDYLISNGIVIDLVITNKDKRSGRGLNLKQSEVKSIALKHKCNIYETNNLDIDLEKKLSIIKPDLGIIVAYKYLPKRIFSIPKFGCVNLHASLLPKHTGASPIQYTILKNDKVAGLTTFVINNKIDHGDIICSKKIVIDNKILFTELYSELSKLAGPLLIETIATIKRGSEFKKQNPNKRTFAPKITKNQIKIDWKNDSEYIHNQIRAMNYIGAYAYIKDKRIKFYDTTFMNVSYDQSLDPGRFKINKNEINIETGKGLLIARKIQLEGKKITSVENFKNNPISKNNKFN
tara:strand:- start:57 stop:974 length:918 start_codon:yes stop_codon:yes gene_type:complete